jgi:hypothetical protein
MGLYTKAQLKQLISSATQLGYWDDVADFKAELAKLEKESTT